MSHKLLLSSLFLAAVSFFVPFSVSNAEDVNAQSSENSPVDETAYDQARSLSVAIRQASQKALPASVKIRIQSNTDDLKKAQSKLPFVDLLPNLAERDLISGAGSGFIVDPSGIVVTNCHVVQEMEVGKSVFVELDDGRRFQAKKILKDEKADVAVVIIECEEQLPFLTFADSDVVEIGDWVLAIGNPFMLGSSVSAGIISARERFRDSKLFLQTDAAVNPGNSGGPLVNLRGEVVGMNTAIASLSGGYQGIGFAIPSNAVQWIVKQLREKGKVERAFLGASLTPIEYNEARRLNLPTLTGVRIETPYRNSPAANAGLRANDVLLTLDGQPIESPEALEERIERADVNKDSTLKILRNNSSEPIDVTIRFTTKPDNYTPVPVTEKFVEKGAHRMDKEWGVMVIPSTPESVARIGADGLEGIVVLNVTPGGIAYRAGLRNGMIILKMNGQEVRSLDDYESIKNAASSDTIDLEVWQKKEIKSFQLKVKRS